MRNEALKYFWVCSRNWERERCEGFAGDPQLHELLERWRGTDGWQGCGKSSLRQRGIRKCWDCNQVNNVLWQNIAKTLRNFEVLEKLSFLCFRIFEPLSQVIWKFPYNIFECVPGLWLRTLRSAPRRTGASWPSCPREKRASKRPRQKGESGNIQRSRGAETMRAGNAYSSTRVPSNIWNNQSKCVLYKQPRFESIVLDSVLGHPRLARHT